MTLIHAVLHARVRHSSSYINEEVSRHSFWCSMEDSFRSALCSCACAQAVSHWNIWTRLSLLTVASRWCNTQGLHGSNFLLLPPRLNDPTYTVCLKCTLLWSCCSQKTSLDLTALHVFSAWRWQSCTCFCSQISQGECTSTLQSIWKVAFFYATAYVSLGPSSENQGQQFAGCVRKLLARSAVQQHRLSLSDRGGS